MIGEAPSALEKKFRDLSRKVVEETGYDLYDVEYIKGSKTLRVYIADRETGSAQIEDCVAVDRAFTPYVEEASWIPEDFVLEVSSPGVYRNLKTANHFRTAKGERIQVGLIRPLAEEELPKNLTKNLTKKLKGAKRLSGVLIESSNEKIKLDADGNELELDVANIKKANLDPEL